MRAGFFKGVVLGAVVATATLMATAAMAGTGVGAVFNIGATNTVNNPTTLTGNSAKTLQLINAGDGPALGLHVKTGQPPLTTNSHVKVANLNADTVDGVTAESMVQGGGRALRARVVQAFDTGSAVVFLVPGVVRLEGGCSASGFTLLSFNASTSQAIDMSWADDGTSNYGSIAPAGGVYLAMADKTTKVITEQVSWPGHVLTIVTTAHWKAGQSCLYASQAIVQ